MITCTTSNRPDQCAHWRAARARGALEVSIQRLNNSFVTRRYLANVSPLGASPRSRSTAERCSKPVPLPEYLCKTVQPRPFGRIPGTGPDGVGWIHFAETVSQHLRALTQQHVGAARRFHARPL